MLAAYIPCNVQQEVGMEWVGIIGGVDPSAPVTHTSERRADVGGQLDLWLERDTGTTQLMMPKKEKVKKHV